MEKADGNMHKNSYFRIVLYVICKIYFFRFIHEIILVFIFKKKWEIAMSNKNKTQSCGNKYV